MKILKPKDQPKAKRFSVKISAELHQKIQESEAKIVAAGLSIDWSPIISDAITRALAVADSDLAAAR